MIRYSTHEGVLASWALAQWGQGRQGIFPQSKGWQLGLNPLVLGPKGLPAYGLRLQGEGLVILLLALVTRQGDEVGLEGELARLKREQGELVLLCDQKSLSQLLPLARQLDIALISLGEKGGAFAHKGFDDPRLDFRLQEAPGPLNLARRIAPLPSRHEGGEEALPLFQALFHGVNRHYAQGQRQLGLETLLEQAIPYWAALPKPERRRAHNLVQRHWEQLCQTHFQGLIRCKEEKKRDHSHPKTILLILAPTGSPKHAQALHRAEQAALRWLRLEQPQLSLFDPSMEPLLH